MSRAYVELINAKSNLINKEVFNIGSTNHSVFEIAEKVKQNIGHNVELKTRKSDDIRSYLISSQKIRDILGFKTNLTISDAVVDLKKAFDNKLLNDTFNNENYFNIKKMQSIKLL